MDDELREKVYGSKRSPTCTFKRGFFEHPSDRFIPMQMPKASIKKRQRELDVGDQINYMLQALQESR